MNLRTYSLLMALCLGGSVLIGCAKPQSPTPTGAATGGQQTTPTRGGTAPAEGKIPLGVYMCNTGDIATFGQSSTKAIRLAVEEINAAGGVLGKQIDLIVEDDQSKPEEAANAAQKLIQQDNVLCVLGEVASSNSLAAAPICQTAKTPMVTPSSTNEKVTQTGDFIFRVCFTDDFQGLVMSRFARETLKAKTAVILSDVSSDYSKGLSKVFRETFTKAGGQILGEESYAQKDKDFRAQLTKFKSLNPDVMYIPGYYTEIALVMSQARQLGITAPGIGGDGWDSPKLVEIAGKAVEGCYFSNHYSKDDPNPVVQKFVRTFQAKHNEAPDALAACAYDAVRVVAEAIKQAGKADRAALRDALAKTRNFDGVTGRITIDANRNAQKPATILTIKGGKQVFVQTMAQE
jgi:branched-chain amino acid transport system substrate-binding protein